MLELIDAASIPQDKEDDIKVGVKSTALRFGDQTKLWLAGFSVAMIPGMVLTGIACDQTWPYYLGVAFIASHLFRQVSPTIKRILLHTFAQ